MTNKKRVGALLLCAALLVVLSVSVVFIACEADHDCCGEDCPVCRMIAVNIRLLRTLGLAVLALALSGLLVAGQSASHQSERLYRILSGTLVSWKIRLND